MEYLASPIPINKIGTFISMVLPGYLFLIKRYFIHCRVL